MKRESQLACITNHMISRAVQNLGKWSKRPRFHISPRSFAGPPTNRQRFFSSSQSTYEWMYHPRQLQSNLQSMPMGGDIPSEGCKRADLSKIYVLIDTICPNIRVAPDPRIYSNGRWLRWDKLERESRYIEFDFAALCKRAIELCPGAMSIASYEKKEGGYNKVFIFTMNDARRVVARLPTRISGPPRLTTNSEVATITYCGFWCLYLATTQLLILVRISAIQNKDPHTKSS